MKHSTPIEIIERIIRNLPIRNVEYNFIDTKSGRLYFAIGLDARNAYQGVWAFTRGPGVARVIEYKPNQSQPLCIKQLVEDGCQMLVDMEARGLLGEGAFKHG